MQTGVYKVCFLKRASVDLADNEKVSLWESTYSDTIRFQKDAIQLDGKWRMFFPLEWLGGLAELIIKPLIKSFLKERTETISVQNLERVVIHKKKKGVTFHLFQTRDQGMVEVHIFIAYQNVLPQVIEELKAVVPANLLQEKSEG
jgi:hypothetical protein